MQLELKPKLDDGQGLYHIFAWHLDETDKTAEANGFALNLEQGFGNCPPFFRYSYGDQDRNDSKSNAIRQSANVGIGYDRVFGRSKDWIAVVASWAEPTDESLRDQSGLELDSSFRLTPHAQWIHHHPKNPVDDNIRVAGLRAKFEF